MSYKIVKDEKNNEKKERRHSNPILYILSVIILIVIVVTFVGAPVISRMYQGNRLVFGSYAGREIFFTPGNYFARQQQRIADQVRENEETDNIEAQLYRIWRGAFDMTVFHTALMVESEKSGMDASSTQIDRMMAQYPGFMENGEFSERKYNAASSSEKYNLRKLMRETVIHEQYLEDILSNVLVGSEELSFMKSVAETERKFQFIAYRYDQFPREQVVTYGEANRKKFEQAKLSVITINSSKTDAQNILDQINNRTSSFESLARNHSDDIYADQGGDAGLKYYHELERDFTNTSLLDDVFDMNPGEVSDVLETTYGWVIYRLDEAPIEADFSRDEMIETVRNYMFSFERGLVEDYLISQSEEFISQADEDGFLQAAENAGLAVYNTDFFPINYGNAQFLAPVNSSGFPEIADAAFNPDFFRTGFGLEPGEISEPVIQRDYILVLSLLEERQTDESTGEFLDFYYPVIARQFTARDIERFYLNSDKLVDNFDSVFFENILRR